MKRKIGTSLVLLLFAVAVLAVILVVCFSKRTVSDTKLFFLHSYGCINVYQKSENPISLAFITKGEPMQLTESFSIALDTSSITLKDSTIEKSFSYSGFTLWYLNLNLDIVESNAIIGDTFRVKEIMLNGIYYDIGEIDFKVFDDRQTASYLNLKSCSGASLGTGLSDYYANFENATSDQIYITGVDVPRYDDAGVAIIMDGQDGIVNKLPVSLDETSMAEVRVLLKNCSKNTIADVYYVSPIVHYTYAGNKYQIRLNYFSSGLNISKTDFHELCQKYFTEE